MIRESNDPSRMIREVLADYRSPRLDYLPSFHGGLVGYFAYDYIQYSEPTLRLTADDQENFQDVDLMLFDRVIAFDNIRNKIILIVNVSTEKPGKRVTGAAKRSLRSMRELILRGAPCAARPPAESPRRRHTSPRRAATTRCPPFRVRDRPAPPC